MSTLWTTKPRRGEVWYIAPTTTSGGLETFGRTVVVISNNKGNMNNSFSICVPTTTNLARQNSPMGVLLESVPRTCVALCNQLTATKHAWFSEKVATLTTNELEKVSAIVAYALDLQLAQPEAETSTATDDTAESTILDLEQEVAYYKMLYTETLRQLAQRQLHHDLDQLRFEISGGQSDELQIPNPLAESPAEIVEEPSPATVDINLGSTDDLISIGFTPEESIKILKHRPYTSLDRIPAVCNLTSMKWALLKPRLSILVAPEPEKPKSTAQTPKKHIVDAQDGLVNLNTATEEEIVQAFHLGLSTVKLLIAARKHQPFTNLSDLHNRVPRIGAYNIKKLTNRVCF
jgi:mRNA-degrading endonuclease toxin of MazEF toxin-antitoxin module